MIENYYDIIIIINNNSINKLALQAWELLPQPQPVA